MSTGRTLPHDPAAERGLLGSIIADSDPQRPTLEDAIAAGITTKSFADPDHARVFHRLVQMRSEGWPIESHTLAEQLTRAGMEQARAVAIVFAITEAAPTCAYFKPRLADVLELERRRQLITAATTAAEAAFNGEPAADVAQNLRAAIERPLAASSALGRGVTAAELCLHPPETPAVLIDGILYRGGTMMLSGPSKSRKTYSFIDLAVSVATGVDWLGYTTSKVPVLYLNFELVQHSFERRLVSICSAKGVKPPAELHLFNRRGKIDTIRSLGMELPRLIESIGAGLVILDPWYKVSATSDVEENSNDAQARVLAEVERIVTGSGAALMVGHHFAKGNASAKNSIDRGAGAGAMARWGDVIATLTEHEEKDCMTLEMHLRDFAPVNPQVLRWQLPLWRQESGLDPTKLKSRAGKPDTHPASALLAKLRDGMTNQEWQEASGWSPTTYRNKRNDLLNESKVIAVGGCYRRA